MIFHSIPSSNILKTTLFAGRFSSHKKDRLNHKWQITFRLYFLLLAREKAGVTAQQETSGTEMEDTLNIAMAAQWKYLARRQQNACGLAKRDTWSVRKHRGTRKGSTCERCAKTCLWLRAAQTPLRGGGNLLRVPQRGGHHGGATIEAGHWTEPAPQPGQGLGVLGHPPSGIMCPHTGGGRAWPPWPKHFGSTHHEDPAEKQTTILCATTVLFSTRLISVSVFSITHQAKDSLMPIPKGTLVFSGCEIWKRTPCQTFIDPSKVPRMASCQHQGASSSMLC